jgi:hypothetical protein
MNKLKLHEFEALPNSSTSFDRVAVPGGWLYRLWNYPSGMDNDNGYAALCFVPSPRAPHARDRRRLRIRESDSVYHEEDLKSGSAYFMLDDRAMIKESLYTGKFTAWHADGSQTRHDSLLEAHDALVESGSPSPFEVVKGAAVETPQTHA